MRDHLDIRDRKINVLQRKVHSGYDPLIHLALEFLGYSMSCVIEWVVSSFYGCVPTPPVFVPPPKKQNKKYIIMLS